MTATLTLSVEIELGWGKHDLDEPLTETLSEDRSAETRALDRLLDACDRLDVPMTFAVVGHLLDSDCSGHHDGPHDAGWFNADPGTDVDRDPLFYAPDLVEDIVDATSNHEVCTHTYSHVRCGEVDADVVAWELDEARRRHDEFGLPAPTSFVPPHHSPVDADALVERDIDVVRRPFPEQGSGTRDGLLGFLDAYRSSKRHGPSQFVDGVHETYCESAPSLTAPFLRNGQREPGREHAAVPLRLRQRLHRWHLKRALDAAIRTDEELHLWTHLYNLSNYEQWPPIRRFLSTVAEHRDAGDVEVKPMAALFDR